MRKRDPRQLCLDFSPRTIPPAIPGYALMFGRPLWYDWRTCCWVKAPNPDCVRPS